MRSHQQWMEDLDRLGPPVKDIPVHYHPRFGRYQSWLGRHEVNRLLKKCDEFGIHLKPWEIQQLHQNKRGRSRTQAYCSILRRLERALRERMAIADEALRR